MDVINNRRFVAIWVHFFEPPGDDGRMDFFFGSLSAIYTQFTADQVGATLMRLWARKITTAHKLITRKCIIEKIVIQRKEQINKRK